MLPYDVGRLVHATLVVCAIGVAGQVATGLTATERLADLVRAAGDAEQEVARLKILRQCQQQPNLDPALKADVDRMVAFVERWNGDPSLWRWWDGEIRRTRDYDFGIEPESLVYPLTCLYRGRMLVWATNEYGNILHDRSARRQFLDQAVRQFEMARRAFPGNRVVGMYLGVPIPAEDPYPNTVGAPEWAALQREGLERLADIVVWWIDHRLQAHGEYGGGWDDDCEMWRHWVPVMIAFEYPKVSRAQALFSSALLRQDYLRDGYTSHTYDVEHTAEPTSDTITPMLHLAAEDPAWQQRAMRLAELMETVWTGRNQRGMLQFKSTYFNARSVDPDPAHACDTPYHVAAIQPALLLWQRTRAAPLTRLLTAWLDTWVDAAARAERGKPAGVIPAAISWPSGIAAGPGPEWWDPRHHSEPTLYQWPSAVSKMTDALLLAWHITADERYLQPIRSMATLRQAWLNQCAKDSSAPGSEAWCGSRLGFLAATLAKYRLLTGRDEFDELLRRDFPALHGTTGTSDRSQLSAALRGNAAALRINFPGYTSEVRYTDRVLAFPRLFGHDMMFAEARVPNNLQPNPNLLYATATGDRGGLQVFPLNAVRWWTPPCEIAALVTDSGRDRFAAELFHFGAAPRPMGAEFYLLSSGRYTCDMLDDTDTPTTAPKPFVVTELRARIEFTLPARQLIKLRVTKRLAPEP